MTGEDLCDVEDVLNEGNIMPESFDEQIAWKIESLSEDIKEETRRPNLTSENRIARKCCIYGVLAWMESAKLITTSRAPVSQSEGDVSMSFSQFNKQTYLEQSYEGKYFAYLYDLMENEFSGITVGKENGFP